jgi:hypothetical protein
LGSFLSSIWKCIRLKTCAIGEVTNTQRDKKSQTLFYWESKSSWFLFGLFFFCDSRSRETNSKRMWPQKSSVATFYNVNTFCERL